MISERKRKNKMYESKNKNDHKRSEKTSEKTMSGKFKGLKK